MKISKEKFKFIVVQLNRNPAIMQITRCDLRVVAVTRTLEECLEKINRNIDQFELYENQLIGSEYINRYVEKRFMDSPIEIISMKSSDLNIPPLKKYFPLLY